MNISHVLDTDPERLGGVVCFIGTRVPVRNLFDYLAEGHPLEAFLDDFPRIDRAAALAVLASAADLVEESVRYHPQEQGAISIPTAVG
jgi:uncharacterized protein (DUF433 family)